MRSRAVHVGVLDDEARFGQAISRLLRTYGFKVRTFENGHDLFAALNQEKLDCLLLDLHMPDMTGFDVLQHLNTRPARPPVIVITGHDEPGNPERVRELSATDYLLKPVDETALLKSIERCLTVGGSPSQGDKPQQQREPS